MPASIIAKANVAGTSTQSTTGIDTTGANFLLMVVVSYTPITTTDYSDNKSNTWTWLTSYGSGPNSFNIRMAYVQNPTSVGAGHTVTGTTTYQVIFFYALSGMAISGVFDVENGAQDQTSPGSTGTITPSSAGELLVSAVSTNTAGSITPDAAWTSEDYVNYVNNVNPGGAVALINTYGSTTPIDCTWTLPSSNNALTIASFVLASGSWLTRNYWWDNL